MALIRPIEYRGWTIVVSPQKHPRFPKFYAMARKRQGDKLVGFNGEGESATAALTVVKAKIDSGKKVVPNERF